MSLFTFEIFPTCMYESYVIGRRRWGTLAQVEEILIVLY